MALEKANELEEEQQKEMIERTTNALHQSTSQQNQIVGQQFPLNDSRDDSLKQQQKPNGHVQQQQDAAATTSSENKHMQMTLRNIDEDEV